MREKVAATVSVLAVVWLGWNETRSPAQAQLPDLVSATVQYMPSAALEDPRPAKAQVTSYDAAINVPLPLGESTFAIPGAVYHVESVSFEDTPPSFTPLRAFHSLELPLLFVQLLPARWALSIRVAPGLAGDFEAVDSGLVRVSAVGLATHAFSDRFVLGGGGLLTYSFGSLLPLPAAYLEWKPLDGVQVEMFVPAFVQAKYRFGDRFEVGIRAEVNGNAYAVRDARIADAWPCAADASDDPATEPNEGTAEPDECFDHVAYSVGTTGITLGLRVFASVWWTAFVGHTFFRRFEQMNEDDDPITDGTQDLPNVLFLGTGLTWRLPLPED